MPKPPAEFILHRLYKGQVEIKELVKSHGYRVMDEKNGRNWEKSPSATGLTGTMDSGDGLMMYPMSEAMKFIDRQFQNKSLKQVVEDENFTLTKLFKDARLAHKTKSGLGKSVGTASHTYVEEVLKNLKKAQDTRTQVIVPPVPRAVDLAAEYMSSFQNIVPFYKFKKIEDAERFKAVITKDIEVRSLMWQESMMIQSSCEAAESFFIGAMKQGALRVWAVEKVVHSRKYFYSGKFDAILEFVKPFTWRGYTIPIGVYITDFKTSNPSKDYPMGIYPNYLPQTGLYDIAWTEEFPEFKDRISGHLLLGSSKQGAGFHPYLSKARERNRLWAMSLVPVMEYMHLGEKELKGVNYYGGKDGK